MSKSKRLRLRRDLSAPGLLATVLSCCKAIEDPVEGRKLTLSDCLMSALAMFKLKYPSLLSFDRDVRGDSADAELIDNLERLFGIGEVPSDTAMRERLDLVDPQSLRRVFTRLFARFQRGGGLEPLRWRLGGYLLAVDGTEYFRSKTINCKRCSVRRLRSGETEYFHQMVAASLVSPGAGHALPLMPEMVLREDGTAKNDCGANAVKRLLPNIRREHPHLKVTVLMDALHSRAPQVRQLRRLGMNFIIGAKRSDHKLLYAQLCGGRSRVIGKDDGRTLTFRWRSGAELNSGSGLRVNLLVCEERTPERLIRKGGGKTRVEPEKTTRFGWITDHEIGPGNLETLMLAGRSRWRIENAIFNTLKSQGYNLTHSYGHGENHLACVLPVMMMIAFCIDKIEEMCCSVFKAALERAGSRTTLWRRTLSRFMAAELRDWEHLLLRPAGRNERGPPERT